MIMIIIKVLKVFKKGFVEGRTAQAHLSSLSILFFKANKTPFRRKWLSYKWNEGSTENRPITSIQDDDRNRQLFVDTSWLK